MINIFVANTDGFWSKFTLSYAIKFFQRWYLKEFKENNPEFNWMKTKDIPTHALIGGDETSSGRRVIFESSKTQQLYPYYKSKYEFEFERGIDTNLFWKQVDESIGDWYGFFQLYYFIKLWWWKTFFPNWFINLWGEWFHGGKHIFQWGNMFVASQICTEQAYRLMQDYSKKYNYPETLRQVDTVNANNVMPLKLLDMILCIDEAQEGILIIN